MHLRVVAAITGLALVSGCADSPVDPDSPANPVWNPLDQNAPPEFYRPPVPKITSGPHEGDEVHVDDATFAWTGPDDCIRRYVWRLDGRADSTTGTSTTLTHLDEGPHEFALMARYYNGALTPEDSADSRRFTVNALIDKAVALTPRELSVRRGDAFSVHVRAASFARVDSERVKGLRLVLDLPANVTYLGVDTLGFMNYPGGRVFSWNALQENRLTLEMACVGDPPATPKDSASVVRINLRAGLTASVDSIRIAECEVFNARNNPLTVRTRGARVEVVQ